MRRGNWAYLLPCPHGPERVEETHILEKVGVQPETGRRGEHCDDEEDQAHDCHGEEESDQAQHAHGKVPDALAEEQRPQREEHHGDDEDKRTRGVQLLLPLRALVQPDVVVVVVGFLVLLDADGPQTLDALGLGVVVAFVTMLGVDLGDAKGEEGEREQLECVLGRGAVVDFREEGVLRARFLVRRRCKSTDCSHNCGPSQCQ